MSSTTPSLEIPDLTHALLWREAAVQSNRAAARDHELAREGPVDGLSDGAVWRSFATHYRAQRTLETDTAILDALSPADLLSRYEAEPVESIESVIHRAEQLKPVQIGNDVNPLAQQQAVLDRTEPHELLKKRPSREKRGFFLATFVNNLFGRTPAEAEESRLDELQVLRIASDPDRRDADAHEIPGRNAPVSAMSRNDDRRKGDSKALQDPDKLFNDSLAKMHAERKNGFDAKVDEYVDFLNKRAGEEELPITYAKKLAAANTDFVFGTIRKEELGDSVTKDLKFTHSYIALPGAIETLTNADLQKLSERSLQSGRLESTLDLNDRETWKEVSFLGSYARLHAPTWNVFVNSLPYDWSQEKPNPEHLRGQLLPHHEKGEAIAEADRQRSEELHKQAGWSGKPKDYESWNHAEISLFTAFSGSGESPISRPEENPELPGVKTSTEIDWIEEQNEGDEERDALHHYLTDGVDGYLSRYHYTEDSPSEREFREADKYADSVIEQLQKEHPGASYVELLNKAQKQDRAEYHPSWNKPVIEPAEEKAKADLVDLLVGKHTPLWQLLNSNETSEELFERAERKAGDDLDRMIKENPNASYVELLAQKTAEKKRSAGDLREFENSDLKANYNPVARTVDTLDKQNNTQSHVIVPETGVEPTQEQIETRLEEAKEQVEVEQEEVIEQKADERSEQSALEGDRKLAAVQSADIRLSEIEAELAGTRSLGRDYGNYSNHRADDQSGLYHGPITAETDHHLVQQISPRSNVIHQKQRLTHVPDIGETVRVSPV